MKHKQQLLFFNITFIIIAFAFFFMASSYRKQSSIIIINKQKIANQQEFLKKLPTQLNIMQNAKELTPAIKSEMKFFFDSLRTPLENDLLPACGELLALDKIDDKYIKKTITEFNKSVAVNLKENFVTQSIEIYKKHLNLTIYLNKIDQASNKKLVILNRKIGTYETFTIINIILILICNALFIHLSLLRPLRKITNHIQLINKGMLSFTQQVPYKLNDELEPLCTALELNFAQHKANDKLKDSFLSTMSHEIRTPMNGVIGFLDNLLETNLNAQQAQYVEVIDSSAKSLLQVINNILDYSKIEAGRMELEDVGFDLNKLANELVLITRQIGKEKNIKVKLNINTKKPLIIRGDPTRLRQVLNNLLANAVKFTDSGSIELLIDLERNSAEFANISFSIKDSGIGMTQEQQDSLFQPFTQADSSTTRKYGGTGLGLYIANNIVELMDSSLKVDSKLGEGTSFYFTLPTSFAKAEEQVQLTSHQHITFPKGSLKKFWAMVVDDTPTNLYLMETICQKIGLPYMTATNGQEAVDLVKDFKFDIIFMDIQMPVMDGYTAIEKIREMDNAAGAQIIALTASAMQEDIEKALGAGSTGFIPKPFERNQLLLCIAEHLGVTIHQELKPLIKPQESHGSATVRQMYDFMSEQYRISLGEIKLLLGQTITNWRPQLDDLLVFNKKENWGEVSIFMHRFKGQLGAIGLQLFAESASQINQKIKLNDTNNLSKEVDEFCHELGVIFKVIEQQITINPSHK